MIEPEQLATRAGAFMVRLNVQGGGAWDRVDAWCNPQMPRHREPLSSEEQEEQSRESRSDFDDVERRDDAAAARYKAKLESACARWLAATAEIETILAVCNPEKPKTLKSRDMQLAQVAAEGLCVSCWRNDEHFTEIELRPEKNPHVKARPYYKDRCRFCGGWKAEHGKDPPVPILRIHHTTGRHVTTADVAKALGRPA